MQTKMEQLQKRFYETPCVELFELKPERVICHSIPTEGSPADYQGFKQEEKWY